MRVVQSKHHSVIGLTILMASGIVMPTASAAMLEDSFDHGELSREGFAAAHGRALLRVVGPHSTLDGTVVDW